LMADTPAIVGSLAALTVDYHALLFANSQL
jgi:hypothetical protein